MTIDPKLTAIACGGTGWRAVFAHGVLSALEAHGFHASAYAGSSMAALPVVRAAARQAIAHGIAPWLAGYELTKLPGNGLSDVVLADISSLRADVSRRLFAGSAPRVCIATSQVHTLAGAIETQGNRAGALGRRLQVHAERHDRSWATENFTAHLWDTAAAERTHRLTIDNLEEVLYASTRLLHAWSIAAEIDGIPHVDAVYTCACPAMELSAMEYREIIAIAPETGPIYRDLFRTSVIPEMAWRSRVRLIRPSVSLKSLGVEELSATEQGLVAAYDHGVDQGLRFISDHLEVKPAAKQGWNWPAKPIEPAAEPDAAVTNPEHPGG